MNPNFQPGTPAPETPAPIPAPIPAPRKSRKGLWIGLGIGAVILAGCCVAGIVLAVIASSKVASLSKLFQPGGSLAGSTQNLQAEDAGFRIKLLSVETSSDALNDSQGNSASPIDGYVYLVVKTNLVTKLDAQTFLLEPGAGDATLTDTDGKTYSAAGVVRDSSTTINTPGTVTNLYFYSDEPDGTAMDFYFSVPTGTQPASFQFKDLSPLAPLPAP